MLSREDATLLNIKYELKGSNTTKLMQEFSNKSFQLMEIFSWNWPFCWSLQHTAM